ncbi:hypothetical protein ACFFHQ_08070, partial [Geobacillus jurassicus]
RASLGGPDERREQKFATLVGDHFGMSPTNILLTLCKTMRLSKNLYMFHFNGCFTKYLCQTGKIFAAFFEKFLVLALFW